MRPWKALELMFREWQSGFLARWLMRVDDRLTRLHYELGYFDSKHVGEFPTIPKAER